MINRAMVRIVFEDNIDKMLAVMPIDMGLGVRP